MTADPLRTVTGERAFGADRPGGLSYVLTLILLISVMCGTGWGSTRRRARIMRMEATAFAQNAEPTASGTVAHEGIVASDPAVLPLGSRIRITAAGAYNGVYTVTDTGAKVIGRHIDLCLPTTAEARQFGKKIVVVRVLKIGTGKPLTAVAK